MLMLLFSIFAAAMRNVTSRANYDGADDCKRMLRTHHQTHVNALIGHSQEKVRFLVMATLSGATR